MSKFLAPLRDWIIFAAITCACVALAYTDYHERRDQQLDLLQGQLHQAEQDLDAWLNAITDHLDLMRQAAEMEYQNLGANPSPSSLFEGISDSDQWDGFALDHVAPPFTLDQVGNLTGIGSIENRSNDFYREVETALSLSPLFRAAKRNIPGSTWIYYTSRRQFIYSLPWVASSHLHYTDELLSHEFFYRGQPTWNPAHERFWTHAYIDEYGQGLMVTAATPVYLDNQFAGTLAIDVTLDALSGFLRDTQINLGQLMIVNRDQQLLAHPNLITQSDSRIKSLTEAIPDQIDDKEALLALGNDHFLEEQGYLLSRVTLNQAPWDILFLAREEDLRDAVLQDMKPVFGIILLIFLVAILLARHRRISLALQESEARYRQVFAEGKAMQLLVSPLDGQILDANPAASAYFQLAVEKLKRSHVTELTPLPEDAIEQRLQDMGATQTHFNAQVRLGDASLREVEIYASPIRVGARRLIYCILHDITERRKAEEQIRYRAYYDPLTQLPNRNAFFERLDEAIADCNRTGRKLALLFIDLDQFKYVNDTLGHATGDILLAEVAKRLRGRIRETDLVARLGGDEFTLILTHLTQDIDASQVASELIEHLSQPYSFKEYELSIGASIGITLYPKDGEDAESLLKHADIAMYRAKEMGRNQYQFYQPDMNFRARVRMELEQDLRQALLRGEFELLFQPILQAQDLSFAGVEVLLRWNHPKRGLLMPDAFLAIAEETGVIVSVGEWVLRNALEAASRWPQFLDNPSLSIAINLSRRQLVRPQQIKDIQTIIAASGFSPQRIVFEITEQLFIEHSDEFVDTLHQLNALGVNLSLDDFGTGYSSLSFLRRLPFDSVKIDHTFIHDVIFDSNDATLCEAIIGIGRNLGLKVVAEGVETAEQLAFLQRHGCTQVQGYLFSEPINAREMQEYLRILRLKPHRTGTLPNH